MLPDADYDCGCRVRGGIDPVDGLETSRLYPCPLSPECPNAALFIKTVEALVREDGAHTKITRFTEADRKAAPDRWKPLVRPVSDEAPTDPNALPEPLDIKFECGCRVIGEVVDGRAIIVLYACPNNMECPQALQYLCIVKSRGGEAHVVNPADVPPC